MQNWFRNSTISTAALSAGFLLAMVPAAGQAQARIPRLPDGHPNMNGIWQAMNTANWDLEAHAAQTGLVVDYGAIGAEPGGMGVVEGGEIPYLPAALA